MRYQLKMTVMTWVPCALAILANFLSRRRENLSASLYIVPGVMAPPQWRKCSRPLMLLSCWHMAAVRVDLESFLARSKVSVPGSVGDGLSEEPCVVSVGLAGVRPDSKPLVGLWESGPAFDLSCRQALLDPPCYVSLGRDPCGVRPFLP